MKKLSILILFVSVVLSAKSQIQYLRYNDDFSYLKSDSTRKAGFDKLKFIPISKSINVSFGGEIREQLQYYNNINFGDVPPTYEKSSTWQLWHRLMIHSNMEVGKKTRLFTQLGSTYRFLNPNPLNPEIDQNRLNLHQAFIDHHLNSRWMIRIGRQEISYGSHRLITFREGPNTRLTFDAAIVRYKNVKRKIDVVALSPVVSHKGVFDDEKFKDVIIGAYATEKFAKVFSADYYFLNFMSKGRLYNFVGGKEKRYIAGIRMFSESKVTNYEVEATYQFGKFNGFKIGAYSLSADISHKLAPAYTFVIGFAGNYISGDKSKNDQQLSTYNLLFSKPLYGLTAPIGATNMVTVNPYLKISPVKKSNIYAGTYFMWRQSIQDGTYTPGAIQLRPKPELNFMSDRRAIGTLIVLEANYTVNTHLSLAFDASRFFAGNYTKRTGKGKDISYLSFKSSFKF